MVPRRYYPSRPRGIMDFGSSQVAERPWRTISEPIFSCRFRRMMSENCFTSSVSADQVCLHLNRPVRFLSCPGRSAPSPPAVPARSWPRRITNQSRLASTTKYAANGTCSCMISAPRNSTYNVEHASREMSFLRQRRIIGYDAGSRAVRVLGSAACASPWKRRGAPSTSEPGHPGGRGHQAELSLAGPIVADRGIGVQRRATYRYCEWLPTSATQPSHVSCKSGDDRPGLRA